jgi:3-methyladenine DNA glycosylase AlkD
MESGFDRAGFVDGMLTELRGTPPDIASLRNFRKRISKTLNSVGRHDVLAIADALIARAASGRFLAYELVLHHRDTLGSITTDEVETLGRGMASWADVDCFSCYVSGPAWADDRIADATITSWAGSPDRWWRRAALVSTVPLNTPAQHGAGSTARTLAACRLLVDDRDDMVVKALSWALRVLAKRDPQTVRGFLAEHQGKLAARVVREVGNKLTTGLKNPRKT